MRQREIRCGAGEAVATLTIGRPGERGALTYAMPGEFARCYYGTSTTMPSTRRSSSWAIASPARSSGKAPLTGGTTAPLSR